MDYMQSDLQRPWEYMRKNFYVNSSVCVGDDFRFQTHKKQYVLLNDTNLSESIKIQRMRWFGIFSWIEKNIPMKEVFDAGISEHRPRERPCQLWKGQMKELILLFGIFNQGRRTRKEDD